MMNEPRSCPDTGNQKVREQASSPRVQPQCEVSKENPLPIMTNIYIELSVWHTRWSSLQIYQMLSNKSRKAFAVLKSFFFGPSSFCAAYTRKKKGKKEKR